MLLQWAAVPIFPGPMLLVALLALLSWLCVFGPFNEDKVMPLGMRFSRGCLVNSSPELRGNTMTNFYASSALGIRSSRVRSAWKAVAPAGLPDGLLLLWSFQGTASSTSARPARDLVLLLFAGPSADSFPYRLLLFLGNAPLGFPGVSLGR